MGEAETVAELAARMTRLYGADAPAAARSTYHLKEMERDHEGAARWCQVLAELSAAYC